MTTWLLVHGIAARLLVPPNGHVAAHRDPPAHTLDMHQGLVTTNWRPWRPLAVEWRRRGRERLPFADTATH